MIIPVILFFLFPFFGLTSDKKQLPGDSFPGSANEVLQKMSARLNSIHDIWYEHKREINYSSTDIVDELSGKVFFDFTSSDTVINARYFFEGEGLILAFNGSESFICNSADNSIGIDRSPDREKMERLSFLNHSVFSLKKALPWIIADAGKKAVADTIVGGIPGYRVRFSLFKDMIGTLGGRWYLTDETEITYCIIIRKEDYMPVEIIQTNNSNKDYLKTSFTNIEVNKGVKDEMILFYSSYLGKYKEKTTNSKPLIKAGEKAVDWKLRSIDTNEWVSLSQFKGNLVLMNFWICHCGYCIRDVAGMNELYKKYKGKDFKLLSINAYDAVDMIKRFRTRMSPMEYDILYGGENVRLGYGVEGFPTLILVDKKGTVLYVGSLDRSRIEQLIEENL